MLHYTTLLYAVNRNNTHRCVQVEDEQRNGRMYVCDVPHFHLFEFAVTLRIYSVSDCGYLTFIDDVYEGFVMTNSAEMERFLLNHVSDISICLHHPF